MYKEFSIEQDGFRLVGSVVNKFTIAESSYFDYDELYSIGLVGLAKAIQTFDDSKSSLPTYIINVVKNEIGQYIRKQRASIRDCNKSSYLFDPISTDNNGNTITRGELLCSYDYYGYGNEYTDFEDECLSRIKDATSPAEFKMIYNMYIKFGRTLSLSECSSITGLPKKTISMYISHARTKMKMNGMLMKWVADSKSEYNNVGRIEDLIK